MSTTLDSKTGNPPPRRTDIGAVKAYLSAFEAPRASNRRLMLVVVLLAIAVLGLTWTIKGMLPLRERVPYYVTVNQATGAVAVTNDTAQRYTPSQATERYFLAKWAVDLLQIDDNTKTKGLPDSYAMLRGPALGEWQHFVFDTWKPLDQLKQDPTTRLYATVDSSALVGDDSAVLRVSTHNAQGVYGKPVIVTVKFAILPPRNDAEVLRNPAGIWITHFEVTNEAQQ